MSAVGKRNQWLDLCRALAVLLVVVCHGLTFIPGDAVLLAKWMTGYFGVEIFFCLSGFLIGAIIIDTIKDFDGSPSDIAIFMARRWFRTLPNYYFYLVLNLLIFSLGWSFAYPSEIGKYLVFTQNLLTPHPAFFPEAWSLAVEEIFYLLLPLAFFAIWSVLRRPMTSLLVALLILLGLSMALRYHGALNATHWDEQMRKVAMFRLDSLMWGVLLAVLHRKILSSGETLLRMTGCALLCCLPVAVYTVSKGVAWLDTSFFGRFWLFTITSLGICGMLSLGLCVRLPWIVSSISGRVAKWSYSMYLSNLSALYIVLHFFGRGDDLQAQLLRFAGYLGIVFGMSMVTHSFVEMPFLFARDRFFPVDRVMRPVAGALT